MKTRISILIVVIMFLGSYKNVTFGQMGISSPQVLKDLEDSFKMERSVLNTGEFRVIGQSNDGVALLEIIGNPENIRETSITIGISSDLSKMNKENKARIAIFLRNVFSGDQNPYQWVHDSIKELMMAENFKKKEKTIRHKMITVQKALPLGFMVTVEFPLETRRVREKSYFNIKGILFDANPVVIMDDKLYEVGDSIGLYKINEIGKDYVDFIDTNGVVIRELISDQ